MTVSRRFRKTTKRYKPLSEINVTPFVDVMLVLLIVFMISAPLLTSGVEVNLPHTKAAPLRPKKDPIILSVNRRGEVFIQNQKIDMRRLPGKLKAITRANFNTMIYVRADKRNAYGRVMELMGRVNQTGFQNVALVTESDRT